MGAPRLTVLLLLKGRLPFTRRWLAYAERFLPFPVLVADGSVDEDAAEAAALCARLAARGRAVAYARYPHDASLSLFYAKLADALGRVDTTYVVLADNDDFLWADALDACVAFLDAHPGHSACGGRSVAFILDGDDRRLSGRASFDVDHSSFDLSQSAAAERVRAHFARYHPTWYDVHRTPLLKEAAEALKAADPKDVFLVELWTSFLPLARGPVAHLPRAHLFRQRDTPSSQAASASATTGHAERSLTAAWRADAARLRADIAAAVSAADGLPLDAAQALVDECFEGYLSLTLGSERAARRPARAKERVKAALGRAAAGRALLRPLKAASAALRRLRARPLPVEDRAAARAIEAFLSEAQKS